MVYDSQYASQPFKMMLRCCVDRKLEISSGTFARFADGAAVVQVQQHENETVLACLTVLGMIMHSRSKKFVCFFLLLVLVCMMIVTSCCSWARRL